MGTVPSGPTTTARAQRRASGEDDQPEPLRLSRSVRAWVGKVTVGEAGVPVVVVVVVAVVVVMVAGGGGWGWKRVRGMVIGRPGKAGCQCSVLGAETTRNAVAGA